MKLFTDLLSKFNNFISKLGQKRLPEGKDSNVKNPLEEIPIENVSEAGKFFFLSKITNTGINFINNSSQEQTMLFTAELDERIYKEKTILTKKNCPLVCFELPYGMTMEYAINSGRMKNLINFSDYSNFKMNKYNILGRIGSDGEIYTSEEGIEKYVEEMLNPTLNISKVYTDIKENIDEIAESAVDEFENKDVISKKENIVEDIKETQNIREIKSVEKIEKEDIQENVVVNEPRTIQENKAVSQLLNHFKKTEEKQKIDFKQEEVSIVEKIKENARKSDHTIEKSYRMANPIFKNIAENIYLLHSLKTGNIINLKIVDEPLRIENNNGDIQYIYSAIRQDLESDSEDVKDDILFANIQFALPLKIEDMCAYANEEADGMLLAQMVEFMLDMPRVNNTIFVGGLKQDNFGNINYYDQFDIKNMTKNLYKYYASEI